MLASPASAPDPVTEHVNIPLPPPGQVVGMLAGPSMLPVPLSVPAMFAVPGILVSVKEPWEELLI